MQTQYYSKMLTNKQKGDNLEKLISALLTSATSKSRPTIASGARKEIGDIVNEIFYVECKKRDTNDITLKSKVWKKLCADIPVGSLKMPLYILQNKDNQTWAVLDIKDFIRIIEKYYKE